MNTPATIRSRIDRLTTRTLDLAGNGDVDIDWLQSVLDVALSELDAGYTPMPLLDLLDTVERDASALRARLADLRESL